MTPEQMTPIHVRERIVEIVSDWTDGKIEVPEDASALLLIADYVDSLQDRVRELEEALPYLRDLARCTNPYRAVEVIDKLLKGTHDER